MPITLIRLGNNCNENCVFCTVALDNERELSTEEVKSRLLLLAERKTPSVAFTGGEPTLREDLPELIKFAKKLGMRVELQTNGVLLHNKTRAKKILGAGVDMVVVSLHSHKEEISERLTNSPKTYKKTIEGIKNISKLCKNVQISHVINTLNYKDLYDFVIFTRKQFPGVSCIYFGFVRPNGNALKNSWVVPKISDIDLDVYRALDYCKANDIQFNVEGLPLCYMQGFEEYSQESKRLLSEPVFYMGSEVSRPDIHHHIQNTLKRKNERCGYCSLRDICPGVWKEYADLYGTNELFPVFISKDELITKLKMR